MSADEGVRVHGYVNRGSDCVEAWVADDCD